MKLTKKLRNILGVIIGNAILAYGVAAFYIPTGLAVGGSTGAGVILHHLFGIDAAISVFAINAVLLVGGWLCVGKEFVVSTVLGSVVYPMFLGVFQRVPVPAILSEDKLAGVICAGVLVGLGVGLTLRVGASTGGSDTLAIICNRVFHLPVLPVKLATDYGIMALTFLVVSSDALIYSLMALAMEMVVMKQMMLLGTSQLQVLVMSSQHERIREALTTKLSIGVTMLRSETGWQREASEVILCVIPNKRLYAVKDAVREIDPAAFVTVAEVKEVQGRGFTIDRIPLPAGK